MPDKKTPESPEDQSKRFIADAQGMIDAGELNPIEGEEGMDSALKPRQDNMAKGRKGG